MSGLNLNTFAQQFSRLDVGSSRPMGDTVRDPSYRVQGTRRGLSSRFKHGNNLIVTQKSAYKGYQGILLGISPAVLTMNIQATELEKAFRYGKVNVGETVNSPWGPRTVVEDDWVVFEERLSQGRPYIYNVYGTTPKQTVLRRNDVMETASLEGQLVQVVRHRDGKECEIRPIAFPSKMMLEEQIQNVAQHVKRGSLSQVLGDVVTVSCKKLSQAEVIVTSSKSVPNGTIGRISGGAYKMSYPHQIKVGETDVEKLPNGLYKIKTGEYKGVYGEVVRMDPAYVRLELIANNKHIKLNTSDVYFQDLMLRNGNMFEVQQILDNETIVGRERSKTAIVQKTIREDEIAEQLPGFEFNYVEKPVDIYTGPEFVVGQEGTPIDDDDEETAAQPDGDSDVDMMDQDPSSEMYYEEPVFRSTFNDRERTTLQYVELTKEQKGILQQVQKILRPFGLDHFIDMRDLTLQVDGTLNTLKQQLQSAGMQNFWKLGDEKYTIACLVLRAIIRSGNFSSVGSTQKYVKTLLASKFLNKKLNKNNIYLQPGWHPAINEVNTKVTENLDELSVYEQIMNNCYMVMDALDSALVVPSASQELRTDDLIPLVPDTQAKLEPYQRWVTVENLVQNNVPETGERILWGPAYTNVLHKYKQHLQKTIDGSQNEKSRIVYTFVRDNLERAPFAMQEIQNNTDKLEQAKLKMLQKVWKSLMEEVSHIHTKTEEAKQQQALKLEKERQSLMERRADIRRRQRLARGENPDEPEEAPEDLSERQKHSAMLDRAFTQFRRGKIDFADVLKKWRGP